MQTHTQQARARTLLHKQTQTGKHTLSLTIKREEPGRDDRLRRLSLVFVWVMSPGREHLYINVDLLKYLYRLQQAMGKETQYSQVVRRGYE